jgi:nitrate reductase NapE component
MDQAVTLYGTLKVGAMRENGYLVGIYQMDGMTIDGPPGS